MLHKVYRLHFNYHIYFYIKYIREIYMKYMYFYIYLTFCEIVILS